MRTGRRRVHRVDSARRRLRVRVDHPRDARGARGRGRRRGVGPRERVGRTRGVLPARGVVRAAHGDRPRRLPPARRDRRPDVSRATGRPGRRRGRLRDWGARGRALAAAGVLLAGYFALAWINPSGLGLGDVKLSGPLGAFLGWLGWPAVVAGTLAAFVINAVIALVLLAAGRVGLKSGIAFGPAMVVGAAAGAAYWAWRTSAGLT